MFLSRFWGNARKKEGQEFRPLEVRGKLIKLKKSSEKMYEQIVNIKVVLYKIEKIFLPRIPNTFKTTKRWSWFGLFWCLLYILALDHLPFISFEILSFDQFNAEFRIPVFLDRFK